jgi:hypothetical protein
MLRTKILHCLHRPTGILSQNGVLLDNWTSGVDASTACAVWIRPLCTSYGDIHASGRPLRPIACRTAQKLSLGHIEIWLYRRASQDNTSRLLYLRLPLDVALHGSLLGTDSDSCGPCSGHQLTIDRSATDTVPY